MFDKPARWGFGDSVAGNLDIVDFVNDFNEFIDVKLMLKILNESGIFDQDLDYSKFGDAKRKVMNTSLAEEGFEIKEVYALLEDYKELPTWDKKLNYFHVLQHLADAGKAHVRPETVERERNERQESYGYIGLPGNPELSGVDEEAAAATHADNARVAAVENDRLAGILNHACKKASIRGDGDAAVENDRLAGILINAGIKASIRGGSKKSKRLTKKPKRKTKSRKPKTKKKSCKPKRKTKANKRRKRTRTRRR